MAYRNFANEHPFTTNPYTLEGMHFFDVPSSDEFQLSSTPGKIDLTATSTTQQFALGTGVRYRGKTYRYAKNGAVALTVGKLVQSPVPLAGHIDEAITSPVAGATSIGFTPNTVTTDDMAENEFRDGTLWINDDTGEGYAYDIKSHAAITGGTSGTINLYDPIVLTVGDSATATIVRNKYKGLIVCPSPATAPVRGVTVAAVGANEYCWIQTKGRCPVHIEGTAVISDILVPSATTDGMVMPSAAFETDGPIVGICEAVNATTEYGLADLFLE